MSDCPHWCESPHDEREPRHLTELRTAALTMVTGESTVPNAFLDLRQVDGERPVVHLAIEEMPIARLTPAEAAEIGWYLIELALLAGEL